MAPPDPADESTRPLADDDPVGLRLLAFWEGGSTTRALLPGTKVVVGRALDCDLAIAHASVSRRHVVLTIGATITAEDLESNNGTKLGGIPLAAHTPAVVVPGSVLEVGGVMLVVQGPAAGAAAHDDTGMKRLDRLVALVATSGLSVLLLGETGVGKEVTAERIHRLSPRAAGPLLRLNCAAMPETLLESELFGYERGAFTGATKAKPGLLEAAAGGTVFLDEVADLSPLTQAKLLRVLENREVLRLGSLKPQAIDVRFVAAANRALTELVAAGRFRNDLYFRLNGITLEIPPLRERRGEIHSLATTFLRVAAERAHVAIPELLPAAVRALEAYSWPGNVRELRNVVERAFVLAAGAAIDVDHVGFGAPSSTATPAAPLREDVDAFERARILEALDKAGGNQTKAAEILGVSRRTLVNRLSSYGLTKSRAR